MEVGAYAVLGVDRHASLADVRSAYRQLVRTLHPDAGGDAEPIRLAAVQAAYRELQGVVPRERRRVEPPRPSPRISVYA